MKKSNITTIILLVMTFGLVGAIAYFSMLLNNKSGTAVTQIKKTKASAQTYHKLLALNEVPGGGTVIPTEAVNVDASPTQAVSNPTGQPSSSPAPILLAQNNVTPSVALSPTVLPTIASTIVPTPTNIPPTPTKVPTPTVALLVYRTTTITPTLIPVANTGGEQTKVSPTMTITPSKALAVTKLPDNKLPETGWVQLSTILFIVATTTVFISFLF
ncbi:MAG: hypothetical protein AAB929_00205 [Patescibacteria group bacterium]